MKSGFVAIVGLPNVGKSSVLNAILKTKVSIVSPKPQTTRNKILGIYNGQDCQIVFVDTPGFIRPKNKLGEFMAQEIKSGAQDVDVTLVVVSADKGIGEKEIAFIQKCSKKSKVVVCVNKVDLVNYTDLFPLLDHIGKDKAICDIVPVSAKKQKNIDKLVSVILKYIPQGPKYFDDDAITDKSEKFLASEFIREQALKQLNDEIPHGVLVDVEKFVNKKNIVEIDASIILEKESHKPIVIGKNGERIKKIGQMARLSIEKMIGKSVVLKLFVKIREGWRNDEARINEEFEQ